MEFAMREERKYICTFSGVGGGNEVKDNFCGA